MAERKKRRGSGWHGGSSKHSAARKRGWRRQRLKEAEERAKDPKKLPVRRDEDEDEDEAR